MTQINAKDVGALRKRTGAPMMDCKAALQEAGGDMEKAVEILRKKGLKMADNRADKDATEGRVFSYLHHNNKLGVLVEIACETDFVARNEDFQAFCREVALQIAAMNPLYVRTEEVPADAVAREKEIRLEQARQSGKPEQVIQKMLEGQLSKWMKEICLLDQPWVKDDKKSIADLQQDLIAKIGENIRVRRFARFELGEGLDKKQGDDFAAEVAKTAGLA